MFTLFDPEELIDAYGKYERDEGQADYVSKFINKGWSIEQIAEFLDETPQKIQSLLDFSHAVTH